MNRYFYSCLFFVFLAVFSHVRGQNQATIEIAPLVNIAITEVNSDSFPYIKLYVHTNVAKGMGLPRLSSSNFHISENGSEGELIDFKPLANRSSSYSILLIDHGKEMGKMMDDNHSSAESRLIRAQAASMIFLGSLDGTNDSLMVMGFADDVDIITEMDNAVAQLIQVFERMEVEDTQSEFHDALNQAIDRLKSRKGSKAIYAVTAGETGSVAIDVDSMLTLANIYDIQLNIVSLGDTENTNLRILAQQSDGFYAYAQNDNQLKAFFQEQLKPKEQTYELTYHSTNPVKDTTIRNVDLDVNGQNIFLQNGHIQYQLKTMEDIQAPPSTLLPIPAWWPQNMEEAQGLVIEYSIHIGGVLVGLILLFLLFRLIRKRADANLIVPAITKIPEEVAKNSMRVRIASPYKDKPAKFTIYSAGGKPIKDFIFKGTRRSARIKLKDLPNGSYKCDLANGGHMSESRSFTLQRKK